MSESQENVQCPPLWHTAAVTVREHDSASVTECDSDDSDSARECGDLGTRLGFCHCDLEGTRLGFCASDQFQTLPARRPSAGPAARWVGNPGHTHANAQDLRFIDRTATPRSRDRLAGFQVTGHTGPCDFRSESRQPFQVRQSATGTARVAGPRRSDSNLAPGHEAAFTWSQAECGRSVSPEPDLTSRAPPHHIRVHAPEQASEPDIGRRSAGQTKENRTTPLETCHGRPGLARPRANDQPS
jgi:hypothetical protein